MGTLSTGTCNPSSQEHLHQDCPSRSQCQTVLSSMISGTAHPPPDLGVTTIMQEGDIWILNLNPYFDQQSSQYLWKSLTKPLNQHISQPFTQLVNLHQTQPIPNLPPTRPYLPLDTSWFYLIEPDPFDLEEQFDKSITQGSTELVTPSQYRAAHRK